MTSDLPNTSLPPALPWAAAEAAHPSTVPKPGDVIEVGTLLHKQHVVASCTIHHFQVLWEIEQEDDVLRVWWPAEVLSLAEGQSLDQPTRTIRYEEGEGWATEEATVEFSTNAPTLVDAQGNELDWRMEGCPSPATRAAEAQEAATALRQEMSERGLDAAQQMAVAERLREFVQKLTGDASRLATNGEVDAQHVLQAAEAFVRESKGGHGELEAFVASRSGREGDDEK